MVAKLTALGIGTLALVLSAGTAGAQSKCQSSKIKAAGKKASCLLGLESKQASKGGPIDPLKIAKCTGKFSKAYAKADGGDDCVTTGDTVPMEGKVDAFVDDVDVELAVGTLPNKCQASKIKAAGKKAKCLLGLEAKSAQTGGPIDPAKTAKCLGKFSSAFAKAQAKGGCNTGNDAGAIEAMVDAFIADVLCELGPACGCGGSVEGGILAFTTDAPGGTPTGTVSPARCVYASGGVGAVCTTDGDCGGRCFGGDTPNAACPPSPCTNGVCAPGVCRGHLDRGGLYFGGGVVGVPLPAPIPDYGKNQYRVSCCSGNNLILKATTSGQTGSNLDCTVVGCKYGAPLPIVNSVSPGVSTCVINTVAKNAVGDAVCNTGDMNINIPLGSAIRLTGDNALLKRCVGTTDPINVGRKCTADGDCPGGTCVDDSTDIQPCPICNPSTLVCNGGPDDVPGMPAKPCVPGTVNSVGAQYPTSHDCTPGGTPLGTLPIPYALTTGTSSKTATDLPAQPRVFCGFCFDPDGLTFQNPAVGCTTDADCTTDPFTVCQQNQSGAFNNPQATTISETGTPTGDLTDLQLHSGVLVSVFCIPPTFSVLVDPSAGLPGPGAVSLPGQAQLLP